MSGLTRKWLLIGSAFALVIGGALTWAWNELDDGRAAAAAAVEECASCEQIGRRIESLRGGGASATSAPAVEGAAGGEIDVPRQIARAAADAGLPELGGRHFDAPHRAADGPYLEKVTRLEVRRATLRQVITLLQGLDRPALGLRVRKVHLSVPPDAKDSGAWAADVTLLYTTADKSNVAALVPSPMKE